MRLRSSRSRGSAGPDRPQAALRPVSQARSGATRPQRSRSRGGAGPDRPQAALGDAQPGGAVTGRWGAAIAAASPTRRGTRQAAGGAAQGDEAMRKRCGLLVSVSFSPSRQARGPTSRGRAGGLFRRGERSHATPRTVAPLRRGRSYVGRSWAQFHLTAQALAW